MKSKCVPVSAGHGQRTNGGKYKDLSYIDISVMVREAVFKRGEMASTAWWEAHHIMAKLRPGQSWFGPLALRVLSVVLDRQTCPKYGAIVLGCGYSRTVDRLALSGTFGVTLGVDSSPTSIAAMRSARWTHRARFQVGQVSQIPNGTVASLVIDEGIFDLVQARPGGFITKAWGMVAPGGALCVLGFAGNPTRLINDSALAEATALCVLSRPLRVEPFEVLRRLGAEDPAISCSPWRYGSYMFVKPPHRLESMQYPASRIPLQ